MSGFDLESALRWARPLLKRPATRRADISLPFLSEDLLSGSSLLLNTCVYIDILSGRAPLSVNDVLDARISHHSTVAVQELMHTVGALDPEHPDTKTVVRSISTAIGSMNPWRTHSPDIDVSGRAALLSGVLCRTQGYAKDARLRALHDCTLFLQAQKLGLTVLTANVADFDILLQLIPSGRVLFYRVA